MSGAAPQHSPAVTENCRFCWMCRHVCPVGHVTHRETLTPHAWALTIESVKRGQLQWNRETADVMYACADCGLCRAHCVTDQALPDAIVAARRTIADKGLAAPAVYEIDRKLRAYANPYGTGVPAGASGHGSVALFVGDAAHHVRPGALGAARALLAASGLDPVLVGVGRSSGLLANTLGLEATALLLGRAVLEEIASVGARDLLVLSPADRWTFEYVYPVRLGLSLPPGVAVREVTTVLAEALAAGRWSLRREADSGPWAYHDPCHSPRTGSGAGARALLAALLGDQGTRPLFWREQRAHPCGAVGGLEFTHPALAAELADARCSDARAAGAAHLVTEDPACAGHLASRPGSGVNVVGLYEFMVARQSSMR